MAALALAWLLAQPELTAIVVGPAGPRISRPPSRRWTIALSPAERDAADGAVLRLSVLVLSRARRARAARHGGLHRRRWRTSSRALARGELHNPLRFVVRPPGGRTLMGLMPAHRGGDGPSTRSRRSCIVPGQPGPRPRPASGRGHAPRRRHRRRSRALMNASPDHRDPHRGRLGRRDAAARPARDARTRRRSSAPACRAARTSTRCRPCSTFDRDPRSGAATPAHARGARAEAHGASPSARSRRRSTAPTSSAPPRRRASRSWPREWLAPGRARQRRRRRASRRRASSTRRRSPPRRFFVDRRESTAQRGGRLPLRRCRGRDRARRTSAPSSARCSTAPRRAGGRRRADRLQVARDRGRGPRRGRVRARARARGAAPASRSSSDPARRDPAGPRDDRGRGRPHAAGPPPGARGAGARSGSSSRTCSRSARSRSAARRTRSAAPRRTRSRDGVVTASAGNMAQGVAWAAREAGVPATVVVPEHAPQTKLDAIERLGGRVIKVPFDAGGRRWRTGATDRRRRALRPPGRGRPASWPGTARSGSSCSRTCPTSTPCSSRIGGGGLVTGIASAVKALRPATRVFAVEPETGAPRCAASFAAGSPSAVEYTPSFVDGAGVEDRAPGDVARACDELVDGALVVRSTRPPPRCGCSPSARA